MFIQQAADTATSLDTLATPPGASSVGATVHRLLAPVIPGIPVLAALVVGLLLLLWYLMRVPKRYPFRSGIVGLAALAFVAASAALGFRVWQRVAPAARDAHGSVKTFVAHEITSRPVEPLDHYVPPFPDADSAVRHEQPSVGGLPSGTIWDETSARPIAEVVRYYSADENHPGWQLEFSAPTGVVLRRTVPVLGQLETERLRVQATPNPDRAGRRTRIEFELTRRMK